MDKIKKFNQAAQYVEERINIKPEIGMILGSGLGEMAEYIEDRVAINYVDIPGFPVSTVEGHAGRLVAGKLMGKPVLAMQGRFHFYEGYPMEEVTFPVRVMKLLGIKYLIVTNAAGGVNREFEPGDLMAINDHINMMGSNPLKGKNLDQFGPRFPAMTGAYDKQLLDIAHQCATRKQIQLRSGVYCSVQGPSYETPAEIKMVETIGGDAVGMSTVPEVIVARHCGIKVLGISCITNMAAGILDRPPNHEEVLEVGRQAKDKFIALLKEIIKQML